MGLLTSIYMVLTGGLFVFLLPFFWVYVCITGHYRNHLKERMGLVPRKTIRRLGDGPRVWIHAVSLGEVTVAESIIGALRRIMPDCSLLISTTTEHGRTLAEERFNKDIPIVYAPVDFIGCVRSALCRIKPDIMIFLETEIWPAWLSEARRLGIPTGLINGRISVRSIDGYLRLRPFFKEVLKNVNAFSMISGQDAARIRSMGAPLNRVEVNGNAKYDILAQVPDLRLEMEMRQILDLNASHRVIVAGSTRQGEEEMVLDAYLNALKSFEETILIIVPRHIDRTDDIGALIKDRGLTYQLRTEIGEGRARRTEKVILVNTFGELFKIYGVATMVFCGASLVPLGGQNPLEPAVWGKVVLYGPSMDDFLDAKDLLESAGASVPVSTPEELEEKILWFLAHPEETNVYGKRAQSAVLKNRGAALGHARVIRKLARQTLKKGRPLDLSAGYA